MEAAGRAPRPGTGTPVKTRTVWISRKGSEARDQEDRGPESEEPRRQAEPAGTTRTRMAHTCWGHHVPALSQM